MNKTFEQISKENALALVNSGEKIFVYSKTPVNDFSLFGSNTWLSEAMRDTSWWREGTVARQEQYQEWFQSSYADFYSMASSSDIKEPWKAWERHERAEAIRGEDGAMRLSEWETTLDTKDERQLDSWCFFPDVEEAASKLGLVLVAHKRGNHMYLTARPKSSYDYKLDHFGSDDFNVIVAPDYVNLGEGSEQFSIDMQSGKPVVDMDSIVLHNPLVDRTAIELMAEEYGKFLCQKVHYRIDGELK